jgi:hypothetical protein
MVFWLVKLNIAKARLIAQEFLKVSDHQSPGEIEVNTIPGNTSRYPPF